MSGPDDVVKGLAQMFLNHGWQLDQHGMYVCAASLERTDFAGALQRTIQAQVEAELRKRAAG